MLDEQDQIAQMAGVERKLTRDQKEQLKQIRQRKAQLVRALQTEDYDRLKQLIEVMGGDKLNDIGGLSQRGLHTVFDMFEDMSYEEAMQYADEGDQDQSEDIGAAQDDSNNWFEAFFEKSQFKAQSDIEEALHRSAPKKDNRPKYHKKIGKAEEAARKLLQAKRDGIIQGPEQEKEYFAHLMKRQKELDTDFPDEMQQ